MQSDEGRPIEHALVTTAVRFKAQNHFVGIDLLPYTMPEARTRAARRVPTANLALCDMDMAAFDTGEEASHQAMCVGASGAYRSHHGTPTELG
jgi:hypothetical protein